MGWPRPAPALVLALHLILIAQNSRGATESECNSMSIKEEGILCHALEGECKCSRPCAVYAVRRAWRGRSRKREEDPVVNRPARAFKAHECGASFLTTSLSSFTGQPFQEMRIARGELKSVRADR
jgi:hypothetical protein